MTIDSFILTNDKGITETDISFDACNGVIMFYGENGYEKSPILNALSCGLIGASMAKADEICCPEAEKVKKYKSVASIMLRRENAIARIKVGIDDGLAETGIWENLQYYSLNPADFLLDLKEYLIDQYVCFDNSAIQKMRSISSDEEAMSIFHNSMIMNAKKGMSEILNELISGAQAGNDSADTMVRIAYVKSIKQRLIEFDNDYNEGLRYKVLDNFWKNIEIFKVKGYHEYCGISDMLNNQACMSADDHILACLSFFLSIRSVIYDQFEVESFPILVDQIFGGINYYRGDNVLNILNDRNEQIFVAASSSHLYESVYEAYRIERRDNDLSLVAM